MMGEIPFPYCDLERITRHLLQLFALALVSSFDQFRAQGLDWSCPGCGTRACSMLALSNLHFRCGCSIISALPVYFDVCG